MLQRLRLPRGRAEQTLAYGQQVTVGRYQCISLRSGIKCTVVKLGRGFLISRSAVKRIG